MLIRKCAHQVMQSEPLNTLSCFSQAYYRGSLVEDAPPLDLAKVGIFGLQTFGGVYDEFKQAGVGALELDYIALQ